MGIRLIAVLAALAATSAALAHDKAPRADSRVHDGGMCWDPDVEYPVDCDDDDD